MLFVYLLLYWEFLFARELFVFYFKLNDGSSSYAFLLKR